MSDAYYFDTLTNRHEQILEAIETLNFDLQCLVELLDASIEAEEEHCGIFDPDHSDYPVAAQRHRIRRDNLIAVIAQSQQKPSLH
jgi:hypothetical protein